MFSLSSHPFSKVDQQVRLTSGDGWTYFIDSCRGSHLLSKTMAISRDGRCACAGIRL